MSRREAVATAGALFVVAVVVRALAAAIIVFPKPEDTAYYVGVARNLLEGRGLVSDALWSFATPPLVFPRPAFEVWLPLPTWLAAVPMALLGTTFAAAQISSVVVGAIVPVLAWRLAADVARERGLPPGRARTLAVGTGLTTALYLPLVLHSALPDSTMPFAALVLGAALLMTRIAREPRGARWTDPRTVLLGVLLGLAALTRNEAAWVALTWAVVAWAAPGATRPERLRMIGTAAVVAFAVFAPWLVRNLAVFGSPLPGQALTNALSVSGFDIFAWNDPPTLARYLAEGPAALVEMRLVGIAHNLLNVLLLLGIPVAPIGLLALARHAGGAALRPVVLVGLLTFAVTSLVFPVATTWGTFLHAAGPVHVLLVVTALLALDALVVRVGRARAWTRPVAWLAPALTVSGALAFSAVLLPTFGRGSVETERHYDRLAAALAAAGHPIGPDAAPVISNFPIWVAETARVRSLALPDESPRDVLDLAATFGARLLVVVGEEHTRWPDALDRGEPGAECFEELDLRGAAEADGPDPLRSTRAWTIGCP